MRLFTAINFDDTVKDKLCEPMERLRETAVKGSFTCRENLHLTVVFIGEVGPHKLQDIKLAMDRVAEKPFDLRLSGVGSFKREGGDILWVGADKTEQLSSVYHQLCERLLQSGFAIETRAYKPHLTLARELVMPQGFNMEAFSRETEPLKVRVNSIDLMKSERIGGKLIYSKVYEKLL
ncbi:RNA 2',3'-cyclic phosphodiesterase [Acetanaerobacterium elongatum]|uniref:RNA 2',3'-cyclic phosphodiesterase n=1 Tax=Acetanaerobacterium elongatum TaxID=258515 RepID=A0A1G9V1G2_9FIRM|nr:RNA 2',3'-cyclic phosphodiesterase [Acetanaerobacterium elongatum]SDM66064.1 2'-5' RNA ligase [Acetanaerobacterium elongatum]